SAGVTIVEYDDLEKASLRFPYDSVPFLVLGGDESAGQAEFDGRQPYLSATRVSNGDYVVNDYSRLVYFDSAGRLIRSVGRRGHGPGEFGQIFGLCPVAGDSMVVHDNRR